MSVEAKALRLIADQMENFETYRIDEMGVKALCLRNAADLIEDLERIIKEDTRWLAAYHKWCEMNGCAPSSSDLIAARKELEGKDE